MTTHEGKVLASFDAWAKATLEGDESYLDKITPDGARARSRKRRDGGTAPASEASETVKDAKFMRPNGVEYWARQLGDKQDVEVQRTCRAESMPTLWYGAPGTGKTALVEAAFHDQPGGLFTVSGSGDTERSDFVGSYVQMPGGEFVWVDGPLVKAMESGGVLFIDEIALIDPKQLSTVYSVMDGRNTLVVTENPERGIVTAKPGFYVVGACNPDVPGARMSEALISRFTVQAEYGTDYDLAKRLGVPAKFVNAAKNLEVQRVNGEVAWAPQMRECLAFAKVVKALGENMALRNLVAVAPEIDRDQVASALSRAYGVPVEALKAD
jgi:hypothetical protein